MNMGINLEFLKKAANSMKGRTLNNLIAVLNKPAKIVTEKVAGRYLKDSSQDGLLTSMEQSKEQIK
jgi:hypothetical protein